MIAIDSSVAMKWFKPGERFEAEARDLLQRIVRREVEAVANEILSLEVVRGLRNAQGRMTVITDADIDMAFKSLESLFKTGLILECGVGEVKVLTKEIEMALGLFMADAIHLATAVHLQVRHFVVDDQHFLAPNVKSHATNAGVRIVTLPELAKVMSSSGP